ncbi:hypothetical protein NET02_00795 [Thermomicrobiaceae bacterium CFH 74404]|uniref:Uncharacterized protein n=1 Tax=Thermalbibacter longus TaxID=2951981 RepID=A0AA42B959_9BACT|nr:hypothetical protein [Thermalbibacter longus]MCM8747677.1 hypothetical protein [Thermalbibacter longus]
MNDRERAEQLDRFIDRLLAGEAPDLDEVADPELRELCALALEVRNAREPQAVRPEELAVMAARVAQEVRMSRRPAAPGDGARLPDGGLDEGGPESAGEPVTRVTVGDRRPRRLKHAAELLAAAIVLGLFTGLLILLLGGRAERGLGGSPARPPTPAPSPTPQRQPELPGTAVSPPYRLIGTARTDGEYAVWVAPMDPELTRFEIQAARLDGGQIITVASSVVHPRRFDIDGGIVVWDQADPTCPTGCPSVHAKNLATEETFVVADSEGEVHDEAPALSGSWVVWLRIDPRTGYQAIMARDIGSMAKPIVLTERTREQLELSPPAIDGEWVAWTEGDDDASQHPLLLTRIGSGEPETISVDARPESYAIGGGVLVYIERSGSPGVEGSTGVETLLARRLDTGETMTVRGPLPADILGPSAPVTDGRHVFWVEVSPGEQYPQIWGHDLATGKAFHVTGYGIDTYPHAAGGWLVWVHRPGPDAPAQVYAARFEEIVAPSGGAVIRRRLPASPASRGSGIAWDPVRHRGISTGWPDRLDRADPGLRRSVVGVKPGRTQGMPAACQEEHALPTQPAHDRTADQRDRRVEQEVVPHHLVDPQCDHASPPGLPPLVQAHPELRPTEAEQERAGVERVVRDKRGGPAERHRQRGQLRAPAGSHLDHDDRQYRQQPEKKHQPIIDEIVQKWIVDQCLRRAPPRIRAKDVRWSVPVQENEREPDHEPEEDTGDAVGEATCRCTSHLATSVL